jgi:hypothetical protein
VNPSALRAGNRSQVLVRRTQIKRHPFHWRDTTGADAELGIDFAQQIGLGQDS